ncbi:hypothetical protein GGS21DRAFT_493461 [Xylaria nigripes]|nr:hypothetical protein GGS21DRAFT_493461 [Xylaria nigripes]
MAGKGKKFYAVRQGRIPGVYDTWKDCKEQVDGCPNEYRSFKTREEAEFYVANGKKPDTKKKSRRQKLRLSEQDKVSKRFLEAYQNMCREANLEPLDTVDGCIKNLESVLVNIIDYIDVKRNKKLKTVSLKSAKGDRLLEPLSQIPRPKDAASRYEDRKSLVVAAREDHARRATSKASNQRTEKGLAVIKEKPSTPMHNSHEQDYEIISIHETESEISSPPRTINSEFDEVSPGSPNSSIEGCTIETSCYHKPGIKRELDQQDDGNYGPHDEITLTGANKRRKTLRKAIYSEA